MRIAIFARMPRNAYSGGRYSVAVMAEALALAGHEVHVVSNNRPVFAEDLAVFPAHERVRWWITPDFRNHTPEGAFDFVVYVPAMACPAHFHYGTLLFAVERRARLLFLNFESGNWFNALSPKPRPLRRWSAWRRACRWASIVLGLSRESVSWARAFYTGCPPQTRFDWCYPAINTLAADRAPEMPREKRAVLFTRFDWSEHKGGGQLGELICEALRGYTLVLMIGTGGYRRGALEALEADAQKYGITVEIKAGLNDVEKFTEIKKAAIMLFPSWFEGYGYPPIEAQYCDTPCVAFDLPVLRETSGDGLYYARHGDWEDFRAKIALALEEGAPRRGLRERIQAVAAIETESRHLDEVLRVCQSDPPVLTGASRWRRLAWRWRWRLSPGRLLPFWRRYFG